ncbi:hypothetical protein GCM10025860_13950 [Methanobacterium ferruginis]|nr:hypothetical protein GCM10025860_13950 [Methanobacterium ferruginis]
MLEDILKDSSSTMYEKYLSIIDQAKDILPKNRAIFNDYNNHDIKHAENVAWYLNEILPEDIKKAQRRRNFLFTHLCMVTRYRYGSKTIRILRI